MKKNIQVRLDPEDIKRLEKEAKKTGHTISSFARLIIKSFLDEVEQS